jgi:hypothetical protein
MSHAAQHRSDDKKSNETGISVKNEEQMPTGVHTVEALLAGNVDPVYAAKAQALNDAIQSIGMGRYQVIPSFFHFLFLQPKVPFIACSAPHSFTLLSLSLYLYISCRTHCRSFIVGLVHSGWFWVFCG